MNERIPLENILYAIDRAEENFGDPGTSQTQSLIAIACALHIIAQQLTELNERAAAATKPGMPEK